MPIPTRHAPIDWLSYCAIGYLIFPCLLFFLWFFQPVPGLMLAATTVLGCWFLLGKPAALPSAIARPVLIAAAIIATAWVSFGGAGHFVYANTIDWMVRDALLRDLILASGLPAYDFGGDVYLLRAPLAYNLPAAIAGKLTGLYVADKLLWAWTALGTFLFLALLPFKGKLTAKLAIVMAVPVIFSGMDIVGFMFPDFHWAAFPLPHTKLDWWLRAPPRVAYFANTTQIFWSPHHVIPGWIATALLYKHFESSSVTRIAPIAFVALPLWSPLTWLGLIPLLALPFLRRQNLLFTRKEVAGMLILTPGAIAAILYLTLGAGSVDFGPTFVDATNNMTFDKLTTTGKVVWYVVSYSFFIAVEFAVLALLVRHAIPTPLFYTSVAVLSILPLISLGPYNDLAMRASIPALTMLCIATIRFLQSTEARIGSLRLWSVILVLSIGAFTPYFEFYRVLTRIPWKIVESQNLVDVMYGSPEPHYMIPKKANFLAPLMRGDTVIPGALDYSRLCTSRHPELTARRAVTPAAQRGSLISLELLDRLKKREDP
jgi:hypothetical protein